jgi:hypothetical protein
VFQVMEPEKTEKKKFEEDVIEEKYGDDNKFK